MNYQRIYDLFIADRKSKEPALIASGEYYEKHHIVPRSLGGSNGADNLICLTADDHFFAHLLLAKTHGGRMWFAAQMMINMVNGYVTREYKKSRYIYAMIKANHANEKSAMYSGKSNPNFGRKWSDEMIAAAREKSAAAWIINRDKYLSSFRNRTTEEVRAKLRSADKSYMRGDKNPMRRQETRDLMSSILKNRVVSNETRDKISKAMSGRTNPSQSERLKLNNWLHSPEAMIKQKQNTLRGEKNPRSRPVICIETQITYVTLTEAAMSIKHANPSKICDVLKGRRITAGGYHWAYT